MNDVKIQNDIYAKVQTYDGVGTYKMSDFDSLEIAEQRAREYAEQNIKEKAKIDLQDYLHDKNVDFVENEILLMISNVIKYEDVSSKYTPVDNSSVIVTVSLKATIDTDDIKDYINRDEQDKINLINQNEELQKLKIGNDNKLDELKHKIVVAATDDEKSQIKREIEKTEKEFLAIVRNQEANLLFLRKITKVQFQNTLLRYN